MMLHGWQARVADKKKMPIGLQVDFVELYKEDDAGHVTKERLDVEEAELLASEILEAVRKIKEGE